MQDITVTDPVEAVALIDGFAPYTEFTITTAGHGDIRLMARDIPRVGRRCTDLSHGSEWLGVSVAGLEAVGFVSMAVPR
jgi:hypothetical protein